MAVQIDLEAQLRMPQVSTMGPGPTATLRPSPGA